MAASKYVRASLKLPAARRELADETRDATGMSEGMSEAERARASWGEVKNVAVTAREVSRMIIVERSAGEVDA